MSTTTIEQSKPQGGAPKGNTNAMRHGLRSGSDPPGCSYISKQACEFRNSLEAKILAKTGEIDVYESSLIHTAVAWLKHGLKCRRWLKVNFKDLSADQRVTYSRESPRAFESMTRCLKLLGLDVKPDSDLWSVLDASRDNGASALCDDRSTDGESDTETLERDTDGPRNDSGDTS